MPQGVWWDILQPVPFRTDKVWGGGKVRGCLISAEPESSSAQSWLCPRLGWEQKPGARGGSQLWGLCCFSRDWRLQEGAGPGSRGELHLLDWRGRGSH